MNKITLTVLVFLCTLFMISCSSVVTKDPKLQREWMLVSFKNYSKQDLMKHTARMDLTSPAEHGKIRGSAYMGCNRLFFSSEFKNPGKLKISGIGSTMMACPGMELEDEFSRSFKDMSHYQIEGHFLILTDNQGHVMKFIASDWD
jgi:heat shock protein HslJ